MCVYGLRICYTYVWKFGRGKIFCVACKGLVAAPPPLCSSKGCSSDCSDLTGQEVG